MIPLVVHLYVTVTLKVETFAILRIFRSFAKVFTSENVILGRSRKFAPAKFSAIFEKLKPKLFSKMEYLTTV